VVLSYFVLSLPNELAGLFGHWFNTLSPNTQRIVTAVAKSASIALPGMVAGLTAVLTARRRAKEDEADA